LFCSFSQGQGLLVYVLN